MGLKGERPIVYFVVAIAEERVHGVEVCSDNGVLVGAILGTMEMSDLHIAVPAHDHACEARTLARNATQMNIHAFLEYIMQDAVG